MKNCLAVLALAALASPVVAQDMHAGHAEHADHAAHSDAATATTGARFSLDTPIEQIVADPKGKAVLDADVPGLTTHEHYSAFKQMSLKQVAGFAPDKFPSEVLAKTEADLAAIK
ncbi:hypothetical protein [Qipengyuania sp.]|uniref:hypothetical protein n=1 Tax=Qipengyuania sp. TaxID=2004515 RepID=UPI0035C7D061